MRYRIVFEAAHCERSSMSRFAAYRAVNDRWHIEVEESRNAFWTKRPYLKWVRIATTYDGKNYKQILEARMKDYHAGRLLGQDGSRIVAIYEEA